MRVRVAEILESAESTKQYESPLGIGGISTQNHGFTGNPLFARKSLSAKEYFPTREWNSEREVPFPRRGGAGKTNWALRFKAKKVAKIRFTDFWVFYH